MVIHVNRELCAGCGACEKVCAVGAINIVDGKAVIDPARCTQCEACIDACPNMAITAPAAPVYGAPIATPARAEPSTIAAMAPRKVAKPASSLYDLIPAAGAALAFLGREAAPRLVDVLIGGLERRLTRLSPSDSTLAHTTSNIAAVPGRGRHRQLRYRGGGSRVGNRKGRR